MLHSHNLAARYPKDFRVRTENCGGYDLAVFNPVRTVKFSLLLEIRERWDIRHVPQGLAKQLIRPQEDGSVGALSLTAPNIVLMGTRYSGAFYTLEYKDNWTMEPWDGRDLTEEMRLIG